MDKSEIKNLIQLMKLYKIDHVKIENQDQEIEIQLSKSLKQETGEILENDIIKVKDNFNKNNPESKDSNNNRIIIKSEFVGVFVEPEKEIDINSQIKKGQIIGYIEMGNIKKPINSSYNGIIEEVFVEHNEIVEYGQKLFKIKLLNK